MHFPTTHAQLYYITDSMHMRTVIFPSIHTMLILALCTIIFVFVCHSLPGQVGYLHVSFDPVNVNFNSTSQMYSLVLNISWGEPVEPNGVITSYEVTVAQTDNSSAIVYTNDSLTVTNVTQSVMVLPFTNYTVTVTASTSAGQGEEVVTSFESPEAGRQKSVSVVPQYGP